MTVESSIPFFRALNPFSNSSGVVVTDRYIGKIVSSEFQDQTVINYIIQAWKQPRISAFESVKVLSNIIMGVHFPTTIISNTGHMFLPGKKGLMDFLIFPLLARKLICYGVYEEEKESVATNCKKIIAFVVGVILEIPRLVIGFALTALLSPLAMLVNVLKPICGVQEDDRLEEERVARLA